MIAENRSLPKGQRLQANGKTCSDRFRHSKRHRRPLHHNPVSRENVGGLESKLLLMLLRYNVTHAENRLLYAKWS